LRGHRTSELVDVRQPDLDLSGGGGRSNRTPRAVDGPSAGQKEEGYGVIADALTAMKRRGVEQRLRLRPLLHLDRVDALRVLLGRTRELEPTAGASEMGCF